jgi:hypothetical protein
MRCARGDRRWETQRCLIPVILSEAARMRGVVEAGSPRSLSFVGCSPARPAAGRGHQRGGAPMRRAAACCAGGQSHRVQCRPAGAHTHLLDARRSGRDPSTAFAYAHFAQDDGHGSAAPTPPGVAHAAVTGRGCRRYVLVSLRKTLRLSSSTSLVSAIKRPVRCGAHRWSWGGRSLPLLATRWHGWPHQAQGSPQSATITRTVLAKDC